MKRVGKEVNFQNFKFLCFYSPLNTLYLILSLSYGLLIIDHYYEILKSYGLWKQTKYFEPQDVLDTMSLKGLIKKIN